MSPPQLMILWGFHDTKNFIIFAHKKAYSVKNHSTVVTSQALPRVLHKTSQRATIASPNVLSPYWTTSNGPIGYMPCLPSEV